MIIQLCGLSGAGKSTLAGLVAGKLQNLGIATEVIDGDDYRNMLCRDLGFSKADRCENIRRLGFVADKLSSHGVIVIISAINPYNEIRAELTSNYNHVKTVYIDCAMQVLAKRDTKGLYKRAYLPEGHSEKIHNLTGVNDPFDVPSHPDLHIRTSNNKKESSAEELFTFIIKHRPAAHEISYAHTRLAI